jgi:hypothetical protein
VHSVHSLHTLLAVFTGFTPKAHYIRHTTTISESPGRAIQMKCNLHPGTNATSANQRHLHGELIHPYVRNFFTFVRHIGTDNQVLLENHEISGELDDDDITALKTASLQVRQSWAEGIALRLILMRGVVPRNWDKVIFCMQCGPVHHYANGQGESCPWCHVRYAGKSFPQPKKEGTS